MQAAKDKNLIEIQDYQSILHRKNQTITESERAHLDEFYRIGLKHSDNQYEYKTEIEECIESWYREYFIRVVHSTEFVDSFSDNGSIILERNPTRSIQGAASIMESNVPFFFAVFGIIVCSLACVFSTIFVLGFFTRFLFNPFLIAIIVIGFWGLLATDLAAYIEWRKQNNVKA